VHSLSSEQRTKEKKGKKKHKRIGSTSNFNKIDHAITVWKKTCPVSKKKKKKKKQVKKKEKKIVVYLLINFILHKKGKEKKKTTKCI